MASQTSWHRGLQPIWSPGSSCPRSLVKDRSACGSSWSAWTSSDGRSGRARQSGCGPRKWGHWNESGGLLQIRPTRSRRGRRAGQPSRRPVGGAGAGPRLARGPAPPKENTMNSPKRLARIAGVLYLAVGIFGTFAEGFVDLKMYAASNAAATVGNVLANAGLVRLGVVADLFQATVWVFLAM